MAELTFDTVKEKITGLFRGEAPPLGFSEEGGQSDTPPGFQPLEEEEPSPEGFSPEESTPQESGVISKIVKRFWGTDVEDPVELPRLGAQISFAVAGGILGSKVPTIPGPAGFIVNPVTGAMVGGMGGLVLGTLAPETAFYLAVESGVMDQETKEKLSLSPEELKTVLEGEVLLELATGGGLLAMRATGRGVGRLISGVGKKETEAAGRAADLGIPMMPVQVGNRAIGRGYVAVMGRFPWIGSSLRQRGQAAEDAMRQIIEGLPERVGPVSSWSDVSERIYKDGNELVSRISKQFGKQYEDLWARADEFGTWVAPRETLAKADEILSKIGKETPVKLVGEPDPGPAVKIVKDFIENEILAMRVTREDSTILAKQTLKQMDGVISKIDQEIAKLEPSQRRFANQLLNQLRQAAQKDSLMNVHGEGAAEISRAMRELDTEFSHAMSSLFETTAAKQFGSVEKRGLRGFARDEATRIPVDQLSSRIVKMDSPQIIEELHRLVSPDTFKRITAQVFDDAFSGSFQKTSEGLGRFDIDSFARNLGLDKATGDRRLALGKMLELSGSPLKIEHLDDIVTAGRRISEVEIPNVSSFIARRATIGGLQAIINGVVPGLTVVGGATYAGGTLLGSAVFIGGGKLVSAMLSNPDSARAVMQVLDKEATRLVRREAYIRALRLGISAMTSEEDIIPAGTFIDAVKMRGMVDQLVDALDKQITAMRGE